MSDAFVEHVNITVKNPEASAKMFHDLFGWQVRWKGAALNGGTTLHVGGTSSYVALYSAGGNETSDSDRYQTPGALNHLGIVVDDIENVRARVIAAGFAPGEMYDYEPGRRFYFDDMNGIEIEVVSYQ